MGGSKSEVRINPIPNVSLMEQNPLAPSTAKELLTAHLAIPNSPLTAEEL